MEQETNPTSIQPSEKTEIEKMKKNQKIGMYFLIAPIMGIIVSVAVFVVLGFIRSIFNIPSDGSSILSIAINIINFLFGILGIVSVIGCIVGLPIGIYYLLKK
jgi:hypothetical protein